MSKRQLTTDERRELERLRVWYREFVTEILTRRGPEWKQLSPEEHAEMRDSVARKVGL